MIRRLDTKRKVMSTLFAVLLAVVVVLPACMTLACIDAQFAGHPSMPGMNLIDCLGAGAVHDGLVSTNATVLAAVLLVEAMIGLALTGPSLAPLVRVGWVSAPGTTGPPSPRDSRGERLLI
jgi:hypothetical protein